MTRKGRKASPPRQRGGDARTVAGVVVMLLGVGGVAALVLTKPTKAAAPTDTKPGTPAQTAPGLGGPALSTDGRTVQIGLASQIPQVQGYDTGPVLTTWNQPGWDFNKLGGRQ